MQEEEEEEGEEDDFDHQQTSSNEIERGARDYDIYLMLVKSCI